MLVSHEGSLFFAGENSQRLTVRRGLLFASLHVAGTPTMRLKGLSKRDASIIETAVARILARHRSYPAVRAAVAWCHEVSTVVSRATTEGRWVSQETRDALHAAHPGPVVLQGLRNAAHDLQSLFGADEIQAVRFAQAPLDPWLNQRNEDILAAETERHRAFFDTVESKPLTDEQIRAVVSFDNRVQVVAAAGSGKTSVMVARAAYAVMRGFVSPTEILLLAFNRAAANELQERVDRGMRVAGLAVTGVTATTFHAYGLSVIGRATGRKPRAAAWLDNGQDIDVICQIVDELRDSSPTFTYRWDLFRLVYSRASEDLAGGEYDAYDSSTKSQGYRTANGEVVKSEGERAIADFLFYNGVTYEYERPYAHDTSTEQHSQYRPDFYYATPVGEVWHEHWALDSKGQPPPDFAGYAESMAWKRALHAQHGTTLVETTWAQVMRADGLARLAESLREHQVSLDWNPDRPAPGKAPLKHEDLARLIRSFMSHIKSNSLNPHDLEARVAERTPPEAQARSLLFLELYWQIANVWDNRLKADGSVDFEDMLVTAAEHLEMGQVPTPWKLVLVDEFQDASQARARLTKALVNLPGRHLLAVGDDWQSINRFAGADISVMTHFGARFGKGPSLQLTTTFRCPQSLCDAASAFITRNPRQISKQVRSAQLGPGPLIRLVIAADQGALANELRAELEEIATQEHSRKVSVEILGRYNFDRQLVPGEHFKGLDVTFRTAHGSKGLEADFVIIPNLTTGNYGFPSTLQDDPVMSLAMPESDDFPHAEERRLFYVALTRAKRQVTLITVRGKESPFVTELLKDNRVTTIRSPGPAPEPCPSCGKGLLIQRSGKHGPFMACTAFPRCRHTSNIRSPTSGRVPQSGARAESPRF